MSTQSRTGREDRAQQGAGTRLTRRQVVGAGLVAMLAPPWLNSLSAAAGSGGSLNADEIVLGVSAAFSGPLPGPGHRALTAAPNPTSTTSTRTAASTAARSS